MARRRPPSFDPVGPYLLQIRLEKKAGVFPVNRPGKFLVNAPGTSPVNTPAKKTRSRKKSTKSLAEPIETVEPLATVLSRPQKAFRDGSKNEESTGASSPVNITAKKTKFRKKSSGPLVKAACIPSVPIEAIDKVDISATVLPNPQRALGDGSKNEKIKTDCSDKLASILGQAGVLCEGCERRITERLSDIPNVVDGGDSITRAGKIGAPSRSQVKEKAAQLASEIVQDMENKMKWSNACRRGNAKVYTEGICSDGPEIFLEIFRLDKTALQREKFIFVLTHGEFMDHFGRLPVGESRYEDLPLTGLIMGNWWHRTGRYKIWGTYGKPQKGY